MKAIFSFFCLVFLLGIFSVNAQQSVDAKDVPEVVVSKLGNLFPGVDSVSWQKQDEEYYANFNYEGRKSYCAFSYTGRWIMSKTYSLFEDIPHSLQRNLANDFASFKVLEIVLTENKDVSEYVINLNDTVDQSLLIAYFDIAGNFLRKTDASGNDIDISLNPANANDGNGEKRQAVHPKELPSSINSYIIVNYPEYSIKESYFINNEKFTNTYYIILGEDLSAKTIELWFDFQGKLVKSSDLVNNDGNNVVEDQSNRGKRKNVKVNDPYPENKVPQNAIEYFKKKEARADEVRWDTVGTEYMVSYFNPGRNYYCRMYFDKKGMWTKTAIEREPGDLHPLIQRHMDENYYDYDIYSVEFYTFLDKSKYTLIKIYKKFWMNDPMVYHELYYSTSGRLEKEILADFIDPDEEYLKQQKKEELEDLETVLNSDDLNLDEGNMVDGQVISQKELPSKANDYIKNNYPGYKFLEAATLSENNSYQYSVFLKREGYNERKRLLFDIKGNFLKEEDI